MVAIWSDAIWWSCFHAPRAADNAAVAFCPVNSALERSGAAKGKACDIASLTAVTVTRLLTAAAPLWAVSASWIRLSIKVVSVTHLAYASASLLLILL